MVTKCGKCKKKFSRYLEAEPHFECAKCETIYCPACVSWGTRKPGVMEYKCPKSHVIKTTYTDPTTRREIPKEEFEKKMGYS